MTRSETGVPAPAEAAAGAGLHYVSDTEPGIRRARTRSGFRYVDSTGARVQNQKMLARIHALAIPPAYHDVWICPDPRGHIQATGRDARGRKQYRYHPDWHAVRDGNKYAHALAFGHVLPAIRARVAADLTRPGLGRERILAITVRLLDRTLMRIGNQSYSRENGSFGLTTLRNRHARVTGAEVSFTFRGKGGKPWAISLRDRRLARLVKSCQELPGQMLFQYVDDAGTPRSITSNDVNDYLREISGRDITAKDFRTWSGSVLCALALSRMEPPASEAAAKRNVRQAIEAVAGILGNTATICRKCYVHPEVIEAYRAGGLHRWFTARRRPMPGLRSAEAALLALLDKPHAPRRQRRAAMPASPETTISS